MGLRIFANKLIHDLIYLKIMKNLEKAIFDKSVELAGKRYTEFNWNNPYFAWIYHDRCYYVITNILGSDDIFNKVISGKLQVRVLLELEPHELRHDLYQSIIEMEKKRSDAKITVKTNDMYICGKCKKSQTRSEKVYSSSFDESIPVLVTCLNCNHSWRM